MNIRVFRKYLKLISLLFGLIVILLLLMNINSNDIKETLIGYKIYLIPITFFTIFLNYILDGVCQYILLNNMKVKFVEFIVRICQVQLFSLFLPGRVGDLSLLYILNEKSKTKIIRSYIISKLITIVVLFTFSIEVISQLISTPPILMKFIAIFGIVFVSTIYYNFHLVAKIFSNFLSNNYGKKILTIEPLPSSFKSYVITWLITIGRFFISAFGMTLLLYAGGVSLTYNKVLTVIALIQLVNILPLTPMSIGVIEYTYVHLYSFYGVPEHIGFTIAIIARFLQIVSLIIFSITLLKFPFRWKGK